VDEFKDKASKEKLLVQEASNIISTETRINNLGEARAVVMWLFRDAKVGKASDVFDVNDSYVVAVMSGITEEGHKPLSDVKDQITPAVRNRQKGKMLIEKINAQKGTLDEIAKAVSPDAVVANSSDLKLNASSLPTAGFAPEAVGKAFGLENGKRSAAFASDNGVFVIELQNKTVAPAVSNYSSYKSQLKQALDSRAAFAIVEALKEGANIKDERFRFY
jgi:peptidyl-prolyl cis-trans isomerase D